ncbi:MAG: hypothetical protein LBE56_03120, partial [Tannerella sp.]|nr:hypothetical protein [Tannerella sp.]
PVSNAIVTFFSQENIPDIASTDKNGQFGFYGFNCPDTAVFLLQARNKNNKKTLIGIELDRPDNRHIPMSVLPLTKQTTESNDTLFVSYTEQATGQMKIQEGIWTIELPVLAVSAKKKLDRESFGISSYRFSGKFIDKAQPIKLILQSLPSPARNGVATINSMPAVLYVVDGQRMTPDAFEEIFSSYRADMFESVEVQRSEDAFSTYGWEGSNGAYVFKTKRFTGNDEIPDASIQLYRPEGYCVRKEFYMPAYDDPEVRQSPIPDLRTTIYWNPVVYTDIDGKAEIIFYTSDHAESYSYVMEGIGGNMVGFKNYSVF